MTWRAGLVGVGAVVALAVAGCGGGGGGSKAYTLSPTKACFTKGGFLAQDLANRYLPGTGGNLRVRISRNEHRVIAPGGVKGLVARDYVFLVFQKDPAAALQTQEKAVTLAVKSLASQSVLITRAAVRRGVGVTKNVFFYSATGALTKSERTRVASCLH
jgi:hypothetical protein